MSAETIAYAALTGASAVTTIVGDRIYPDFVPEERLLPAISIARASTEYITTIHSSIPQGAFVTLEIWCMAGTRKASEDLANAAMTALGPVSVRPDNRAPEFDAESEVFAAVLLVVILE
jgi:hypothetical protein